MKTKKTSLLLAITTALALCHAPVATGMEGGRESKKRKLSQDTPGGISEETKNKFQGTLASPCFLRETLFLFVDQETFWQCRRVCKAFRREFCQHSPKKPITIRLNSQTLSEDLLIEEPITITIPPSAIEYCKHVPDGHLHLPLDNPGVLENIPNALVFKMAFPHDQIKPKLGKARSNFQRLLEFLKQVPFYIAFKIDELTDYQTTTLEPLFQSKNVQKKLVKLSLREQQFMSRSDSTLTNLAEKNVFTLLQNIQNFSYHGYRLQTTARPIMNQLQQNNKDKIQEISLKNLDVRATFPTTLATIQKIIEPCTKTKIIKLSALLNPEHGGLSPDFKCTSVEELALSIRGLNFNEDTFYASMFTAFPHVKVITIVRVPSAVLVSELNKLTGLKHITLKECDISESDLDRIVLQGLTHLRKITLNECTIRQNDADPFHHFDITERFPIFPEEVNQILGNDVTFFQMFKQKHPWFLIRVENERGHCTI